MKISENYRSLNTVVANIDNIDLIKSGQHPSFD